MLSDSVSRLSGVGPRVADKLERLGIARIDDLLWHIPLRYEDRGRVKPLTQCVPGEPALVQVSVDETHTPARGKARQVALAHDDDTPVTVWFFGRFGPALRSGQRCLLFGEVRHGLHGLEMAHPEIVTDLDQAIVPVYPTTEGLHQAKLRNLIAQAVTLAHDQLTDLLPQALRHRMGWPDIETALRQIHMPRPEDGVPPRSHPAYARLIVEELLAQIVALRSNRRSVTHATAPVLPHGDTLFAQLLEQLAFAPTGAQRRVLDEISRDLTTNHPMLRLVQGDVGSGKTLVAAGAALQAIESGYQVALMAPTALLAEQHLRTFRQWFEPLGLEVRLLSGQLSAAERRQALADVAEGRAHLVAGTHALFQESVQFDALGLVIVDEQHRFGVHQRLALSDKGADKGADAGGSQRPHQLVMTATPIPRTLAMSAYADLDVSIIDELPPGRTPVGTVLIRADRRDEIIERISEVCAGGRQAYWVCPLIEDSEKISAQAAETTAEVLRESLPHLRIGLVHGRMTPAEKQAEMARFKAHELDLLVATTVIEVGVDVPNASLMIIENAERMGLAQLHQLRGRVGRGATASHCVLLFEEPLSERGRARLSLMRETSDGFRLAEADLELRGPGEVLGTRQTGLAQLRIADLARDAHWLDTVRDLADELLDQNPEAAEALIERWVGSAGQYGRV